MPGVQGAQGNIKRKARKPRVVQGREELEGIPDSPGKISQESKDDSEGREAREPRAQGQKPMSPGTSHQCIQGTQRMKPVIPRRIQKKARGVQELTIRIDRKPIE